MKNAEDMRANTLEAQERKKRDKFNSVICNIEKTAEQGFDQCNTYFKKFEFTTKELQKFSDYLTSNGYAVDINPTSNAQYIMCIKW